MNRFIDALKIPFFTVLLIFVFLYIFTKLFGPIPFSVNSVTTSKTDLFTVTGEGEATAVPTTAQFSVGVMKTAPTVEAARDQVTQAANTITAELKKLGVEEKNIKTTNYSVYPNREFSGRNDISGYTAQQDMTVKVEDVNTANKALDAATKNGANQVGGISFTLTDEERERLEDQARKQAIEKAKKKAQSIANAAGVRLGRIVSVQESNMGQPMPFEARSMVANKEDMLAQPIAADVQPGENTINLSVSLSYETL